ncbi:MAG: hypothetical protein RSE15_08270 [Flavobacterium sp.]|uniref:hypothetical protein n=1 Tax=Flavobacterium sp. TaxID=239 RepID=UPI002B48BC7F|nr:hypothetical protein [Flavobacterium sp.]WRH72359.1 MAG: hypothetical protein RSE15_08270 [Flavobacterium sp.]
MKENKNIERLFQKKFKDFEALPPEDSWDFIADRLHKKKKKRIIPIWFQLSGVAASILLVGGLIWNFTAQNETEQLPAFENTIVNGKETNNNEINSKTKFSTDESLVYDSKEKNNKKNSLESDQQNNNKSKIYKENLLNKQNKINSGKTNTIITYNELEKNTDSNYKRKKKSNNNFKQQRFGKENPETVVISNTKKSTTKRKSKFKSNKSNVGFENEISTDLIVADKSSKEQQIMKNDIDTFFEESTTNKTFVTNNDSINSETNNTNVLASTEIICKDSTLIAEVLKETNPLEELLKEKEVGKNEDEKEEKRSKWAISTNASPVYFNSLAEGSSIDEQFNSNSKNYTTTLSIGLAGSYAINDKLSLKTGVNSINLSYNTNDVLFESRMREVDNNIPTISRNANASNMVFSSKNGTVNEISGDVENVIIDNNIGALKQNISYIEVPLELSYKLIDKKFGVEIIGGMSTLFLNQNNISLVTNGLEMEVGRANNLNNIHFSSNVGLGFKYSFWKSFNANFQPMFKYQINTFNQNSSNFKPYFIGLYSGISFSF